MTARLVVIHGVCAGMGQSTLFEGLRGLDLIPGADYLEEDSEPSTRFPGYPAHFDRPEFAEVADRFWRHNADRAAGVGHPTADMLETVWRRLVAAAQIADRTLVSGLSFIDGAEDLDWAMASEPALHEHARAINELVAPLDPVFIELDGDITAATDRAVRQRGRAWFRFDGTTDAAWEAFLASYLDEATTRARRLDRAMAAGGWHRHRIDGTTQDAAHVLGEAVELLRREGVVSRRARR
jgi:hypothetical protein